MAEIHRVCVNTMEATIKNLEARIGVTNMLMLEIVQKYINSATEVELLRVQIKALQDENIALKSPKEE